VLPDRFLPWVQRQAAASLLALSGCRARLEGAPGLPDGALLLASNHASYVDVAVLLAVLPRRVLFVTKQEVWGWPLVGRFVRRLGHVAVRREDARDSLEAIDRVQAALDAGQAVAVFPEATFTAADGLRAFRLGAFRAAAGSGVSIVPIALEGTRRFLRDGTWLPRPGTVRVWVGAPETPRGEAWGDAVELRDRVARQIAAHCGEPRLDRVAGPPA